MTTTYTAFVSYEISPVYRKPNDYCEVQESIEIAKQRAEQEGGDSFWSLYGRNSDGTVEHIMDGDILEDCTRLYERITGNPGSASRFLPATRIADAYCHVDAAYVFDGLRRLREWARTGGQSFSYVGAGELEDFGFMFERAIDIARAIHATVEDTEYERLAVFVYEQLDAKDPLLLRIFEKPKGNALDIVRTWCAAQGIAMKPH